MAETSSSAPPPPQDSAPPPPPPPTGDPVGRPPLRRSRTDRVIGGVAGGLGRHFGVDPILLRIGFVVLAVVGGPGLLLYLLGWLLIAPDGDDESAAVRALRGDDRRSNRNVVAIVLLVLGLVLIGGPLVWITGEVFGGGLVFPLLLVAAGVTLLVWPQDHQRRDWHGDPTLADLDNRASVGAELAGARDEIDGAIDEVRSEWQAVVGTDPTTPLATDEPPVVPPLPPPPVTAPPPPRPPQPPRPRPFVGPLTLALLLVFTGSAIALDRADVIDVDPAVGLAIALVITGAALTVTAFVGRARGLIVVGILLMPALWWFHAIDLTWWEGIGEESATAATLDELDDEYRFGVGQYIVDFSDLDLDGTTQDVAVGLTIGELIVCVPDDLEVALDADGRIGEIRLEGPSRFDETTDEGFDPTLRTTVGDDDRGRLELDLDIGLGSARVLVHDQGGLPCE